MTSVSYLRKKRKDIDNIVIVYPFTYVNPYFALPPIGAEYLQAGITETGREALLLDMRYEKDITRHLEKADLVCLYGYFEDCSIFGKWKVHIIPQIIDQIPSDIPIIAGGTGFSNTKEAFKSYPRLDLIIRSNPEIPIQELLNGKNLGDIKNLAYRSHGEVIYTERIIHALPENVYPRRNLRNPKYNYHMMGIKTDLIRAGVGCNYKCKFCYEYGKDFDGKYRRWQGRSAQSLFNEIKEIDAPIIAWVDDDMTTSMKTLGELADLLIESRIHKLFAGTGRIDHVNKSNPETLKKLEKAGLIAIGFGVESLRNKTLQFYGKGQTVEHIEKAMRLMQKTNILLICNFIFGSPGETEQDMLNMLWFGRKWNVDTLVTNRLRVPKDSPMYDFIYDPETGKVKPGMERIRGDELAKIKYKVKFAQRTPFRILLSLLKLYRHQGMFIDPLYLFCCTLETVTKHTWLEKTKIFPLSLKITKKIVVFPVVRQALRFMAIILTPPLKAINWIFELIDKHLQISTNLLPKFLLYIKDGMYKKQCVRAQVQYTGEVKK
ncbi:MAG: B12-binding domain-containing radical SAM protein [Desulfobacterales bacterium]|nr:B12-binding domain-containing radical SAM protein [Desulfobacterales bacterium]